MSTQCSTAELTALGPEKGTNSFYIGWCLVKATRAVNVSGRQHSLHLIDKVAQMEGLR